MGVPKQKQKQWISIVGWISSFGMTVAISAYLGLRIGLWLDEKLGFEPFFLIFCITIGLVGPFYGAYRKILQANEEERLPRRK